MDTITADAPTVTRTDTTVTIAHPTPAAGTYRRDQLAAAYLLWMLAPQTMSTARRALAVHAALTADGMAPRDAAPYTVAAALLYRNHINP